MSEHPTPSTLADGTGQRLYREARRLIPGGTQLLSKRPEMFAPDIWPAYYQSCRGCEVIDLDGNRYVDMSIMAVGASLLGYADPEVNAAVIDAVERGSICTLNSPDEVAVAKKLIELHPWAEMARFGRTGGEAMTAAVRIARAATGRDVVAFCGYHGWHDWYLAANVAPGGADDARDALDGHLLPGLEPRGVPRALAGTALPFHYNRIDELKAIVDDHGAELAAVVMEPTRSVGPEPGLLEGVRELCDRCGARLVFDEISVGWRLTLGGAHRLHGVEPDVAVFGKTLGNGHPMAAIIGKASTMDAAQDSFISSSYWTEAVGPAAALAFMAKAERVDVSGHMQRIGRRLGEKMVEAGRRGGVSMKVTGYPGFPNITLDVSPDQLPALQTLMNIRMLERGLLWSGACTISYAHREEHVDACAEAAAQVLPEVAEALARGDAMERIGGQVKQAGFARLT